MCFCFEGENAVAPYKAETCRERGRAKGASPVELGAPAGKPDLDAASRSEPIEAMRLPHA